MSANFHFKELLRRFNDNDVRYLVVGGYAVMKYTEPRYTKDLDVWVEPSSENAVKVYKALAEFGAPLDDVTLADLTTQNMVFQIGMAPYRIDIIMGIGAIGFSDAWERRVQTEFDGEPAIFISKKDLIASKEFVGRPQDLIDLDLLKSTNEIR